MVFQLSRYLQLYEYSLRLFMVSWFVLAFYAFIDEKLNPPVQSGGWVIAAALGVAMFSMWYQLAHFGAELVVDDTGLTTRHRGWRLWPAGRPLRIRIPRHLPVQEIGRVQAIHDYEADLGIWFGSFRGENIKMTCSCWGPLTKKAIAVVQERPGLQRRLWLFDVDDPDPIAKALVRVRDTHNPDYLERVADEERRKAAEKERRARIPNPSGLDNSILMPPPDGDLTYQWPKAFPGHREVVFDNLALKELEPSPPFNSFTSAEFELTVTAITTPTPLAELVGPAIHLVEADNLAATEPTTAPPATAEPRATQLRRAPLGRPISMKPGNGTFRLRPLQGATIHLHRRR